MPKKNDMEYELPKIKTQWNKHLFPDYYEINNQPSLTVPDQTMTIKQILDRYARGIPFDNAKIPIYDGEDDVLEGINWQSMDLTEREAFKEQISQELFELQRQRLAHEELLRNPPASQPPGETTEPPKLPPSKPA